MPGINFYDVAEAFTLHSYHYPSNLVWSTWLAFDDAHSGTYSPGLPISIIRNIDQCISMSDAALLYGCDIDNSIAYNSLLPNPLFRLVDNWSIETSQAMMDAIRYLCKIGYDMEERNSEGDTLFLYGATLLSPSVITSLKFLIGIGADLYAVNPFNCGALHLALMAPYGWDTWGSDGTDYCNYHNDHDFGANWSSSTESESYAEDYCNDGLTPAPCTLHDIQSGYLACQERLYRESGGECLPTTGSTRSESHSSRGQCGQYIDLGETNDDNGDEETNVADEGEEGDKGENSPREEGNEDDEGDEDEEDEEESKVDGVLIPDG